MAKAGRAEPVGCCWNCWNKRCTVAGQRSRPHLATTARARVLLPRPPERCRPCCPPRPRLPRSKRPAALTSRPGSGWSAPARRCAGSPGCTACRASTCSRSTCTRPPGQTSKVRSLPARFLIVAERGALAGKPCAVGGLGGCHAAAAAWAARSAGPDGSLLASCMSP